MSKMDRLSQQKEKDERVSSDRIDCAVVGRIAASNTSGEVMVEFNGRPAVAARLISGINRIELCKPENIGREVLLVFENGDPRRPVITGQMASFLDDLVENEIITEDLQGESPLEARIDGQRMVLEAQKEILLKCGKGSIHIRSDGKIVVKGTDIISRSSGNNRLKGSTVNIN